MNSDDRFHISRGRVLRAAAAGAVSASGLGALAACMRGSGGSALLPSPVNETRRGHSVSPALGDPWDKEKVTLRIVNKTQKYANDQIYWISTAKNFDGKFVHFTNEGKWELCRSSDLERNGPLRGYADYNMRLSESGTELTLPWANSGTVFFCMGEKLKLGLNGSGEAVSLVEPAAQTPDDPNFKYLWDKVEYSFNPPGVPHCNFYANTTLITKFALPITVRLEKSTGEKDEGGLVKPGGQAAMYSAFQADPVFKDLVVVQDGHPIRVIGPSVGVNAPPTDIHAYKLRETFNDYIAACIKRYSSKTRAFTVSYDNTNYSCYFDASGRVNVEAPRGKTPSFTFGPIDSTSIWLCADHNKEKFPMSGRRAILRTSFSRRSTAVSCSGRRNSRFAITRSSIRTRPALTFGARRFTITS